MDIKEMGLFQLKLIVAQIPFEAVGIRDIYYFQKADLYRIFSPDQKISDDYVRIIDIKARIADLESAPSRDTGLNAIDEFSVLKNQLAALQVALQGRANIANDNGRTLRIDYQKGKAAGLDLACDLIDKLLSTWSQKNEK